MAHMTEPASAPPAAFPAPALRPLQATAPGGATVLAWRDAGAGMLLRRPRPRLAASGVAIEGPMPLPGEYRPGSCGFRYWSVAEAVTRAAAVWRTASERPWHWQGGDVLRVSLSQARGSRSGYARDGIAIDETATPTAASRALGHAVLDAMRPALWGAAADEVAVFHHAFADITAVLAALELPERRADVLAAGADNLAAALRTLLDVTEPSPFTFALLDLIVFLFRATSGRGRSADTALGLAAAKAARLLATSVRRVPIVPNFLAQMASELAIAAAVQEAPAVALGLRDHFARAMLLPRSPATDGLDPYEAEDGTELCPVHPPELPWVAIDGTFLGVGRPLLLQPASQVPPLAVSRDGHGADPPNPVAAARDFAASLLTAGGMAPLSTTRRGGRGGTHATHRLAEDGRVLRLRRLRFPCD